MKKRVWVISPLFYLMAAALLGMSLVSYRYNKILFAMELTVSVLAIVGVAISDVMLRRKVGSAVKTAQKVLAAREDISLEDFALPLAVVSPQGDVTWCNKMFRESFGASFPVAGENIVRFIYPKTLRQILSNAGTPITYGERQYTVYGAKAEGYMVLYFVDDTFYKEIHKEYREKKPVVCMAAFDNREEMVRGVPGGEESRIVAEVDAVLREWGNNTVGGFLKKMSNGRYLIVTYDAQIEQARKRRFAVLDEVRKIMSSNNMNATVSIGVGRGASNLAESERFARQALDMALGRGGDQVAVMQSDGAYEFFGGLSRGVEKRDKVRTRVIAAAISDHVRASDKVFIMGHKNSDLDSVGSAVGMWAVIAKGLDVSVHVVVDRSRTLAGQLVDAVEDYYKNDRVFISPQEALQMQTEHSLLIITDTHSPTFVESEEMLTRSKRTIVIDHHRMMVNYIREALIFYHEPYASSAAEMVTEIVQYIKSSSISPAAAQALLAGIMLDTKSFVLKTGVRTFEAAAFLRRCGADTVEVKKLFANSFESYKKKAAMVSNAEIYQTCAIAESAETEGDIRIAAAQAADELLTIQGVKASFVLYRNGSDVNISGRSLGDVNVQLILEAFGGGGHFTMAGAQLKDITLKEAREKLIQELDAKLKEVTIQDNTDA
ncbi:DHH family phosphoesterase [Scatolibacter rhodanostii]|uniref:DHH family phosphoesterase n=1 Tax=Scatolibacter rhodanostii TaxID=2014781 RepID=UPI000C08A011|nr:DHH family phosphoesterase [Scatolibacter rhodanostii]